MTKREAEKRVVRAAMEYHLWLLKRDFRRGDFHGPKGRLFNACAALRAARKGKKK